MLRLIRRILLVIIPLIVVIGLALYLFLPLDRIAKRQLEKALGPDFSFDNVTISLAHIEVTNLHHKLPKPIVQVKRIKAYPFILPLLKGQVIIKKIEMESPYLSLRRFNNSQWNITSLFPEKKGGGASVLLKEVDIRNGRLDLQDDRAGKTPYKGFFTDLKLTIDSPISILHAGETTIRASGKVGGKREGRFVIKARWDRKVNSINANVKVEGLDLVTLRPYLDERGGVKVKGGFLALSTDLRFEKGIVNAPVDARIKGLEIEGGNGNILGVLAPLLKALMEKGDEITLQFSVYGPLGNLRTDIRSALEKKVFQSMVETPIQVLEWSAEGLAEGVEGVEKGIGDIFMRERRGVITEKRKQERGFDE